VTSVFHPTDLNRATPVRKHGAATLFSREFAIRVVVGVLLAAAAITATLLGGYAFAVFVGLGCLAAMREWHRMVGTSRFAGELIVASVALIAALATTLIAAQSGSAFAVLAVGAVATAIVAASRRAAPILGGFGTLYIGVPACSLVILRLHTIDAQWIVLGIFLIIWSADTGALLVGKLLGGPKLLPVLSPNKTWAGLIGGLILPALTAALYVSVLGGMAWRGFAVGLGLAAVGHAGDLFESWVKRRVGRKNSGELIPGHGGVLDRIDSTLFVVPIAAVLFHFWSAAQLFGAAP
jgi:phosphatidate cytidylyltransferase